MMKTQTHSGFTLVETLVAIAVLLMSLTGPLFLAERSFVAATGSRDQMIATFLAQEGIEYSRVVRDSNYLEGNAWMARLSSCVSSACIIDPAQDLVSVCSGSCPVLNFNTSDRSYNHSVVTSVNQPTIWRREVQLVQITATEYRVTSSVFFTKRGVERSVILKETLHQWQ